MRHSERFGEPAQSTIRRHRQHENAATRLSDSVSGWSGGIRGKNIRSSTVSSICLVPTHANESARIFADERMRRLIVGLLAWKLGRGGVVEVARITGLHRNTVARGQQEMLPAIVARSRTSCSGLWSSNSAAGAHTKKLASTVPAPGRMDASDATYLQV